MTVRKLLVIVVRAALLGVVVATPLSGQELVSVEIWLAATAVLVSLNLVVEMIHASAIEPAYVAVAWVWRRRRGVGNPDTRPWDLRATEGLITSARTNPRAYANRLRPRLIELTDHFLPINHALDIGHDSDRVDTLLGEVAWLIDPTVTGRTPTVDELDRFFDIIGTDTETSNE